MNKTVINVKTDTQVKKEAQRVVAELGLSLSSIINAYLRQLVRDQELHVSIAPRLLPEFEKKLRGIEYDIQRGRNLSRKLTSPKEIENYLDAL